MTRGAILKAFRVLEAAGLARPYTSAQEVADTADVWQHTMEELSDEQLRAAVRSHLRSERGRFWPSPSELLVAARREQRAERTAPELVAQEGGGDWPGKRAAALGPPASCACLDEAQAEARAAWAEAGVKPCGAAPGRHTCPLACGPCTRDVLQRADALADKRARPALRLVEG